MENLKTFLDNTIKNGGCSYNISTGEINPKDGFMVAIPNMERTVKLSDGFNEVHKVLANFLHDFSGEIVDNENIFIGSWYNKDNGLIYFDLSEKIINIWDAVSLGNKRKQLAIWDNANGKEIRIYDAICTNQKDLIEAVKDTTVHVISYNEKQIRVPNPQTSGTEYQKQTYINNVVRKIVETGTYY